MAQDPGQKRKNLALMLVLLGLAVLLFFLTIVKFGHAVAGGQ